MTQCSYVINSQKSSAQGLMSVAAVVGRLEPIRYDGSNSTVLYNITMTTVGGIISSFENSSSSLGKGVMVVAIHWSRGSDGGNGSVVDEDDVPYGFLRNLQARYKQPVYAVDLHRLLADGHSRDTDGGDGALPQPCRRPVDHGLGSLLPLRSRYVVLFRGIEPPDWDPDPFVELAQLNYTFWDVDVYYLIVAVNGFDPAVRRMVYGIWRDLSIYKWVRPILYHIIKSNCVLPLQRKNDRFSQVKKKRQPIFKNQHYCFNNYLFNELKKQHIFEKCGLSLCCPTYIV